MEQIIKKLKEEYLNLKRISDQQFSERFTSSKHADKWTDDLYRDYQSARTRIDLLLEMLNT